MIRLTAAVALTICTAIAENKGFTVYALGDGGVGFMGADNHTFQSTVVFALSMVCTVGYGTGDTMIGLLDFHNKLHKT